jgi:hypothetical protein
LAGLALLGPLPLPQLRQLAPPEVEIAGPQANPPVMLAKGPRMDLMGLLQVLGQVRAGTGPLTEAELQELERLVRMPPNTLQGRMSRNALLNRLARDGVRFDGTRELQILENLIELSSQALPNQPIRPFLDSYARGIRASIGGLQNINNTRYEQYRRNRWGGAPHNEAWTWNDGGDQAYRRYELERLLHNLGQRVDGWDGRPRPQN